jgi:hypothetical protein
MKKIFLPFFLALVFVFSPQVVYAQTTDLSGIIKQIQALIEIIEILQEQINILQSRQTVTYSSATSNSIEYRDLPKIEHVLLNNNLNANTVFYRFSVWNTTDSLIEWKKITLQIKESDLDVSGIYVRSVGANGNLNTRSLEIDSEGKLEVYVKSKSTSDVEFIASGEKKTYDVRGLINGLSDGGDLSINIVEDTTISTTTNAHSVEGNFIWSKRTSNLHSIATSDWNNGYGILEGVSTLQTYSTALNKPKPLIQNVSDITDNMDLNIYGINLNEGTLMVFINGHKVEVESSTKNRIVVSKDDIDQGNGYHNLYIETRNGGSSEVKFYIDRTEPSDVAYLENTPIVTEGVDLLVEGASMSDTSIVVLGPLRLFPNSISEKSIRIDHEKISLPNGTYNLQLENNEAKKSNNRSVVVSRVNIPTLTSVSDVTATDDLVLTGSNLSSNPVIKIGGISYDASTISDSQLTIDTSRINIQNGTYSVQVSDLWSNQSNLINVTIVK